jgi:hypothetical protein
MGRHGTPGQKLPADFITRTNQPENTQDAPQPSGLTRVYVFRKILDEKHVVFIDAPRSLS